MWCPAYPEGRRAAIGAIRQAGILAVLALFCAAAALPAGAQSPVQTRQFSRSYVTPFPEGDRYRLYVFGDSLGDGVWAGLYRAFKPDGNVDIVKKSRVSTGFVRTDYFDWNKALSGVLKTEKVHIAVVMVGANDVQSIRTRKGWLKAGTEEWRDAYAERIDAFIKRLKESHVAVYWVGLPIMRSDSFNQTMQVMNEVFRERAFINGAKFIDTWNGFADQFGRYSAFGPDLSGQIRRLRAEDGVHFTIKGYRKLAHFVEREIRRDLRIAKAERNIPLAGDEAEQARAMPRDATPPRALPEASPSEAKQKPARQTALPEPRKKKPATKLPAPPAEAKPLFTKTDKTVAGVRIVRPAISTSALAAVGPGYAPEGETIANDIGDGLTALASVSPINDPSLSSPQRLPLTQRPYYRVLIKGEQLKPKAGRADDFSWPPG